VRSGGRPVQWLVCRTRPGARDGAQEGGARANQAGRDPELAEIRNGLRRLTENAEAGSVDPERVDLLARVARVRIYAIKTDSEIARHSAEIRELEDAYDRLLSDYEALRDGKATTTGPEGWYLRRGAEE
jgi:hypothetical protein